LSFAVSISDSTSAAREPPLSEPAKSQFLRPRGIGRTARSAALLSISMVPSSMNRPSAVQRVSA
jgi:hypothetical protein